MDRIEATETHKSGGAHTSRTMMLGHLRLLLAACPSDASFSEYRRAVIEGNVLAKASEEGRKRTFRYLRELYALDLGVPAFHALRTLWDFEPEGQRLIALSSALFHDAVLRATADEVMAASEGASITADSLANAVQHAYPGSYSDAVARKVGRNAAATWTQSGHLDGRSNKIRSRACPTPASVAYALFLASRGGQQGEALFDSLVVRAQDAPNHVLRQLAREAARRGWIEFRSIGTVTEIGFSYLESERGVTA